MLTLCNISVLAAQDCPSNPAGVKGTLYLVPAKEFASWPAYLGTTGSGDTVKLDGNFSFTGAGIGKGFWRAFPCLLEKGQVTYTAVGGKGSKSLDVLGRGYVLGVDAAQLEWFKNMMNAPMVGLWVDKNSTMHVIGSKDDPAYLEEGVGDTGVAAGDERGINFAIKANAALPAIYTGTVNVTPLAS